MADFPKRYYGFISLTGNVEGSLDHIPGTNLKDQDFAFGTHDGKFYSYLLDADSGLDENPPYVIAPTLDAGNKRWILKYSKQIAQNVEVADANDYWNVSNSEDAFDQIGNCALNRMSRGWYSGGDVICNSGSLTVDVASGTGSWDGTKSMSWDAKNGVPIASGSLNYIYIDTADSTAKSTTVKSVADAGVPLAIALADKTEAIKISPYRIEISDFHYRVHEYLKKVLGPVCETGMSVSINTPSDLNIVVDTGAFHWGLFHYSYTTESPCSFTYWHKVTDSGITHWVKITSQTSINNTKYNLNTGGNWSYADLDTNKYRKDLICVAPKTDGSLAIAVILGQEQFSNLSDARNGAIPTLGDLELMGFASLAYVIIKQGASSIAEVGDMRPLLGQYGAMQDHGSLTGLNDNDHPQYMLKDSYSDELANLTDAEIQQLENIGATTISSAQWKGLGNTIVRTATLVVAANDSSAKSKAQADYMCDGVDDQVEIQAAIDALPNGGGKIQLLEGTFVISSSINLKSDCMIEGCGTGTVIKTTTEDINIINATSITRFRIYNLKLLGPNSGTGAVIYLNDANYSRIEGCHLENSGNKGELYMYNSSNVIITGNYFFGNNGYGIYMEYGTHDCQILYNRIENTVGHNGINIDGGGSFVIIGNEVSNSAEDGIRIYGVDGISIIGNWVTDNDGPGIYFSGSKNFSISGNYIADNNTEGLYLKNVRYGSVSNNSVARNSQGGGYKSGILLWGDCHHLTIQGNNCTDDQGTPTQANGIGVYQTTNSNILIKENILTPNIYGYPPDFGDSTVIVSNQHSDHFQDCLAASTNYVHTGITGTGSEQEITTNITNPDVPRNISVTVTNNASPSGDVTITGTDAKGNSITESITLVPGGTAYGDKAFATVSKITVPATVNGGGADTVTVGIGDKLGLSNVIYKTGDVYKVKVNNADKTSEFDMATDVDTDNGTVDMSSLDAGGITAGDDVTIYYRSNLNIIS